MPADERQERLKAIDLAVGQIEKQFGKGSIMRLGQRHAIAPTEAISSGSISIDYALGIGGFPRGRVVEIYGPESSGKTTLALQVIAEAQKKGGLAAFVDAEHALDAEYARKLGVAQTASMSWSSTRSPRSCRGPKSKARWAKPRWGCRPA
jgi:recombination protein RecA